MKKDNHEFYSYILNQPVCSSMYLLWEGKQENASFLISLYEWVSNIVCAFKIQLKFYFWINSTSCLKSNLILHLLHNLHVIRNDLQSDKTRPTEILTTTVHPLMNFSTTDSGAFSISVHIILVKLMRLEQITDRGHLYQSRTHTEGNYILLLVCEVPSPQTSWH